VKNDANILAIQLQNGNTEALAMLYELLSRPVFLFAYSVLRHKEKSEDVMQATFIKMKISIHQYKPNTNFKAWAFTIARNLALTELNRAKRTISADEIEYEFKDTSQSIETQFEHQAALQVAMQTLIAVNRQIVVLNAIEGFKMREIATLLTLPLGTVLWRYNMALKQIKQELIKRGESHEDART